MREFGYPSIHLPVPTIILIPGTTICSEISARYSQASIVILHVATAVRAASYSCTELRERVRHLAMGHGEPLCCVVFLQLCRYSTLAGTLTAHGKSVHLRDHSYGQWVLQETDDHHGYRYSCRRVTWRSINCQSFTCVPYIKSHRCLFCA